VFGQGGTGHEEPFIGCQQTKTSRPPGRIADLMLAKAATGSAKNITPNREITASNEAGSSG
jgi:hypothetical protein